MFVEMNLKNLSFSGSFFHLLGGLRKLFQPSQPLLRIFNLSNSRVSVFPEIEEFLVMLYGFGSPGCFFVI